MSQRPHRRRTWAPRGQTPVLQFHFNWKTLSVIAGVTVWNFYFEIFEQAIKSEQIIEFLKHLLRCIEGDILLIGTGFRPTAAKSRSSSSVTRKAVWSSSTCRPTRRESGSTG
ncbi:MAG: transposase [Bryobacteraceae bacterium]